MSDVSLVNPDARACRVWFDKSVGVSKRFDGRPDGVPVLRRKAMAMIYDILSLVAFIGLAFVAAWVDVKWVRRRR